MENELCTFCDSEYEFDVFIFAFKLFIQNKN